MIRNQVKNIRRNIVSSYIRTASKTIEVSVSPVVIIAPHPDDETFGCGGLIALKREKGADVHVIFLSCGEGAHRNCCKTSEYAVGNARTLNAQAAVTLFGLLEGNLSWLDFSDGAIPAKDDAHTEMIEGLADLIFACNPAEVYTPVPFDCWLDHERAFDLVEAAVAQSGVTCQLFGYPVWMWHNLRLRDLNRLKGWQAFRLEIGQVLDKKQAAMHQYLDSVNPSCGIPWCGNLPPGFLKPFHRSDEIFFRRNKVDLP